MAQRRRLGTHVPKFGQWDANDHAPYTVVFETARAGRTAPGGKPINPNDPEETVEPTRPPPPLPGLPPPPTRGAPEAVRETAPNRSPLRGGEAAPNRSPLRGSIGRSPARTFNGNSRTRSSSSDGFSIRTTNTTQQQQPPAPAPRPTLPKFGEWDTKDPSSGEGFTAIFATARTDKRDGGAPRVPQMQSQDSSKLPPPNHKSHSSGWLCCFGA